MHPSTKSLLRFFDSSHLPEDLARVVRPFEDLANRSAACWDGPELTAGLRKLLEAKDCMVRAAIMEKEKPESS